MFARLTFIKLSDASNPTLPPQKPLDRALAQLVPIPIRGCLPPPPYPRMCALSKNDSAKKDLQRQTRSFRKNNDFLQNLVRKLL